MPITPPDLEQSIHVVPAFTLENDRVLKDVPVAYKTWGRLNASRDNVMIICHAFTGSADVEDWWGPLMGRGKAFDSNRFFIFCANALGSPYGTASPVTLSPDTGRPYGPEFPQTSVRDDVRLHKLVLDHLGVTSVAVVIGGSMGGMAVLEWPLCSPPNYVRHIVPIATSARHSAWCISWGETQRQCIYSDPAYQDGYYAAQPSSGLAAARMTALLTYRSRDSFERRFGRRPQPQQPQPQASASAPASDAANGHPTVDLPLVLSEADQALLAHNEGHQRASLPHSPTHTPTSLTTSAPTTPTAPTPAPVFSAQSYLRYQGAKFVARFDANCYIHITRKMDTHDVARGRVPSSSSSSFSSSSSSSSPSSPSSSHATTTGDTTTGNPADPTTLILATLPPRALVLSIGTDGLFTPTEQHHLATHIPGAELVIVSSPDGHDGFLLEFEQINAHVLAFLRRELPAYYEDDRDRAGEGEENGSTTPVLDFKVAKTSLFGEAEADVTRW